MTPLCRKIVAMALITFEGSEGCGKSTQVKRLAARLEKCGIRPTVLWEPGGYPDRWANLAGYNREPNLEYTCSTLSRPRETSGSKDQTPNIL